MSISIDAAIDFQNATLEHIQTKKPAYTFLYETYAPFNTFWKNAVQIQGGTQVEGRVVLGDEGNAKHSSIYDEDTLNVVNISKKYTVEWVHATTNYSMNLIEMDMNRGNPEKIYDENKMKYDNMCREIVDAVYAKIWSAPTSATDANSPLGIPCWLRFGTNGSTGGWTGYSAHYNDGSATTFNLGGLASSATSNARWASYYADHDGNLDDSLLQLLDRACRKLNFQGPTTPVNLDLNTPGFAPTFSLYSNDNVIGTLNLLYAKSDDQMGARIQQHFGTPYFKNMPLEYVSVLDTADTDTYQTDPIIGINHKLIYPVVLSGWNFKISTPKERAAGNQHLWVSTYCDLQYCIFGQNPRHAGFLIAQQ